MVVAKVKNTNKLQVVKTVKTPELVLTVDQKLVQLLTVSKIAEETVNTYCNWAELNIPFSYRYKGTNYGRTSAIWEMILPNRITSFTTTRSANKDFFLQLGSLHFEDKSVRKDFIKDYRYLNSWLYNPQSVAAILLMYQPGFNKFIGTKNLVFKKRYSVKYLNSLISGI